jgi:hypothetical protein
MCRLLIRARHTIYNKTGAELNIYLEEGTYHKRTLEVPAMR